MDKLTINIEAGEAGLFHATCPQMPELFVSGESVLQTLDRVPEAVSRMWLLTGVESKEGQSDS